MQKEEQLIDMLHIGPVTEKWLHIIGLDTPDKVRGTGVINEYLLLEESGLQPSLNALYAIYGAIHHIPWNAVVQSSVRNNLLELLDAARNNQ